MTSGSTASQRSQEGGDSRASFRAAVLDEVERVGDGDPLARLHARHHRRDQRVERLRRLGGLS
jgi:hypothetical protein